MSHSRETVTIHQAKTHLSRLIAKVAQGERIIICKGNRPVAQLVPLGSPGIETRTLGLDSGKVVIANDFEELPRDFLRFFRK